MNQLLTELQRLQLRLQRINRTGAFDQISPDIANTIARILLDALFDDQHPLSIELNDLEDLVHQPPEQNPTLENNSRLRRLDAFVAEQIYFVPQPGNADPSLRKYWPLQLLLSVAASSPENGKNLAEKLLIAPEKMKIAAANGAKASVSMWSKEQYFQCLEQAVATLESDASALPIQLDDRTLKLSTGKSFRLSQQSAKMLSMLIARLGQAVTYSSIMDEGIQHPVQAKKRLLQKCENHGVQLLIDNSPHAYCLRGVRIQTQIR